VGDHVFLKKSPLKGNVHFGQKGKLTLRFIGPFEVLQRIGPIAYHLALALHQGIHDIFYVSNMRRYVPDPSHVIEYEPLQLKENLAYVEEQIKILDIIEHTLRNRTIPFLKVLWKHHQAANACWEPEWVMREKYSALFESTL